MLETNTCSFKYYQYYSLQTKRKLKNNTLSEKKIEKRFLIFTSHQVNQIEIK